MGKQNNLNNLNITLRKLNIDFDSLPDNKQIQILKVSKYIKEYYDSLVNSITYLKEMDFNIVRVCTEVNISRATIYRNKELLNYLDYISLMYKNDIQNKIDSLCTSIDKIEILENSIIERDLKIKALENANINQKQLITKLKDVNNNLTKKIN